MCDSFLLGHAEVLRQHQSTHADCAAGGRGYPLEMLVLGSLTHKSPRCLQVGNGYSDIIIGCASSICAGCLQSCTWTRGVLFELVQTLVYVVPGSVCEEHIDVSYEYESMQLSHEAVLIVLQNDSSGKVDREPRRSRRCSHLSRDSSYRH